MLKDTTPTTQPGSHNSSTMLREFLQIYVLLKILKDQFHFTVLAILRFLVDLYK